MTVKRKPYELTPAHKKKLKPWADRWIKNAMSTTPMNVADKKACVKAVRGLYEAAGLNPPKQVVFVPSPFALRFAGGFAAAIWWKRANPNRDLSASVTTTDATNNATYGATNNAIYGAIYGATNNATRNATYDATCNATNNAIYNATSHATSHATNNATNNAIDNATNNATYNVTYDATCNAIDNATYGATNNATYGATNNAIYGAIYGATNNATRNATYDAVENATYDATNDAIDNSYENDQHYSFPVDGMQKLSNDLGLGQFGLSCAKSTSGMWNGGNQWSGWPAFLSFFRHIAKLPIDYSKWKHYEILAERSGPRIEHSEFCMISDRPTKLLVDDENRPHCDGGPFCEWSDGSAIYALHGVYVPKWVACTPVQDITAAMVASVTNTDVRRELMRRIPAEQLPNILKYDVIDRKLDYELVTFDVGDGRVRPFLKMKCPSTGDTYVEGVRPEITTIQAALAYKLKQAEYKKPIKET
jgi:hypothetical protein